MWDISPPLGPRTVGAPGEPPPALTAKALLSRGDRLTSHRVAMSCHAGMHLDAPAHFVPGGAAVDDLPVDRLCGPCAVIDLSEARSAALTAADLAARAAILGDRVLVLLKTANSRRRLLREGRYVTDWVHLGADAAHWLIARGTAAAGIDYLSFDACGTPDYPVHHALLGSGVLLLENCDLTDVPEGRYALTCLALRLEGSEGAPVRAFLRPD